jgi:regulator of ribosome biosynthesis
MSAKSLSVAVDKPIPYEYDLGLLAVFDTNVLDEPQLLGAEREPYLREVARDAAQGLINQLLSLPIRNAPEGTLIDLPERRTQLPREKSLPKEKEKSKWERFAAKKGIKPKDRKSGRLVYDEERGDWVPKWGYKGKKHLDKEEWLHEVKE